MAMSHVPSRITITDAGKVFLTHREGAKIAPATLRKYRTFVKQLAAFADSRGSLVLDQFASSDIDVFYGGWNLGARAKGKQLGTLRAFFRFSVNRTAAALGYALDLKRLHFVEGRVLVHGEENDG